MSWWLPLVSSVLIGACASGVPQPGIWWSLRGILRRRYTSTRRMSGPGRGVSSQITAGHGSVLAWRTMRGTSRRVEICNVGRQQATQLESAATGCRHERGLSMTIGSGTTLAPPTQGRGFASMMPEKLSEVASKGGKAAHSYGAAHEWTSKEAQVAGRKGGAISKRRPAQRGGA